MDRYLFVGGTKHGEWVELAQTTPFVDFRINTGKHTKRPVRITEPHDQIITERYKVETLGDRIFYQLHETKEA